MFATIRTAFISGLLVLAPLGITVLAVSFLLEKIGTPASHFFFGFLSDGAGPGLQILVKFAATFIVVLVITLVGFLSKFFLGRFMVNSAESLITRVPGINALYKSVKQIVDTFSAQNRNVFEKPVLVQYPRLGTYSIGFLTGEAKGEVQAKTGKEMINVFVPTTPNPTSGFLLFLPKEDAIELSMTVASAMKLIISGGAVVPEYKAGGSVEAKAVEG